MVCRTRVIKAMFENVGFYSTDRIGAKLTGCGDFELGIICRKLGWELWYAGRLYIEHVMPTRRLCAEYIDKLRIASVHSTGWLRVLSSSARSVPFAEISRMLTGDALRVLYYFGLSILPKSLDARLLKSCYWAKFYASRCSGAIQLFRDTPRINLILNQLNRPELEHKLSEVRCEAIASASRTT